MNTTKTLTEKTKDFLKPDPHFDKTEHISYFLALCEVCHHNSKLAMELIFESAVFNRTEAMTWHEIWQSEYNFADQINSTYWEDCTHSEDAEAALFELETLESEEDMKNHFIKESNYYLFPKLNIAFCIEKEYIQKLGLKEPGEYQLD